MSLSTKFKMRDWRRSAVSECILDSYKKYFRV